MKPRFGAFFTVGALVLGTWGCSSNNLLEPFEPSVRLLEHETRPIRVRYTDDNGLPIAAAAIRFTTKGQSDGAILSSRVAVTNERGEAQVDLRARGETTFLVLADAEGAKEPARINVAVSRDAGGQLIVSLSPSASEPIIEADVILADDEDCENFDPVEPPPATSDGIDTDRRVEVKAAEATDLTIRGLQPGKRYTLLVIGRAGDQIVARGCRDGIVIDPEQVATSVPRGVALELVDFETGLPSGALKVVTKLSNEIGLGPLAGVLKDMAGEQNGPADYVIAQIALRAQESALKTVLASFGGEIARELGGHDGERQGAQLVEAASILANVEDVELHSLMVFSDETADGRVSGEIELSHEVVKFTADIPESSGQATRRDFSVEPLRHGRRLFGGGDLKFEANAVVKRESSLRLTIGRHSLSLPLVDAIAGFVLFEQFGETNLERIIGSRVHCQRGASRAESLTRKAGIADWRSGLGQVIDALIKAGIAVSIQTVVFQLCQDVVNDVLAEARRRVDEDIAVFRSDEQVVLEGSANLRFRSDQQTIDRLEQGKWTGVGTFEATR